MGTQTIQEATNKGAVPSSEEYLGIASVRNGELRLQWTGNNTTSGISQTRLLPQRRTTKSQGSFVGPKRLLTLTAPGSETFFRHRRRPHNPRQNIHPNVDKTVRLRPVRPRMIKRPQSSATRRCNPT